jgi:histidine triad (HIT) family protein
MEKECVFCNIVAGKIPATFLYQDDRVVAIRDISPQAPTHLLVMPKEHIPSLAELRDEQRDLVAHLIYVSNELARREGIVERGYRLVLNCGPDGGQEVPHLHIHFLGGQKLTLPMG